MCASRLRFSGLKNKVYERDLNILTCGLNLNLIIGVMLIIFLGLPFEPIPVGRH